MLRAKNSFHIELLSRPRDALLRVFIRTNADHDRLEQLGACVGQGKGDVVTAVLAVADVPVLASEPGVHYVELSRPLGFDPSIDAPPNSGGPAQ